MAGWCVERNLLINIIFVRKQMGHPNQRNGPLLNFAVISSLSKSDLQTLLSYHK